MHYSAARLIAFLGNAEDTGETSRRAKWSLVPSVRRLDG